MKDIRRVKKGDIVDGDFVQFGLESEEKIFYYVFEGEKFFQKFHCKYFIPLAECREEQIKSVLDD